MYFLLGLYMLSRSFFRNISHCIFIKMRYLWFTSFCVLHTQHTALFLTTTSSVDNTDKILSTPRTPHNECSSWLYILFKAAILNLKIVISLLYINIFDKIEIVGLKWNFVSFLLFTIYTKVDCHNIYLEFFLFFFIF